MDTKANSKLSIDYKALHQEVIEATIAIATLTTRMLEETGGECGRDFTDDEQDLYDTLNEAARSLSGALEQIKYHDENGEPLPITARKHYMPYSVVKKKYGDDIWGFTGE